MTKFLTLTYSDLIEPIYEDLLRELVISALIDLKNNPRLVSDKWQTKQKISLLLRVSYVISYVITILQFSQKYHTYIHAILNTYIRTTIHSHTYIYTHTYIPLFAHHTLHTSPTLYYLTPPLVNHILTTPLHIYSLTPYSLTPHIPYTSILSIDTTLCI